MSIIRTRTLSALDSGLDSAFDDLMRAAFATGGASWTPAIDVVRDGDDLVIEMEIAGADPEAFCVELRGRTLTVSGQRAERSEAAMRREIRRGTFARSLRLPAGVTAEAVTASYDAGILAIRVAGATPTPTTARIPIHGITSTPRVEISGSDEEPAEK